MSLFVSDEDLDRARTDPEFRQKLFADNLERLLDALNKMRNASNPTPQRAKQIREGVDLAVQLANRLQDNDNKPGPKAA